MKKVILLSIVPLAMLMADLTLFGEQLSPTDEPVAEPTPAPTPAPAPAVGGIVPNSTDLIWTDMHEPATGTPMGTGAMPQSQGPVFWGTLNYGQAAWEKTNLWYEIEEDSGIGNYCSSTTNRATNTRVERAGLYAYWLDGTTWKPIIVNGKINLGKTEPSTNLFPPTRACSDAAAQPFMDLRAQHPGYIVSNTNANANGNFLYQPQYAYRWQGWAPAAAINRATIKAVYVGMYVRLVQIDMNKPNDFDKARYIIHCSSDMKKSDGTAIGGAGVAGVSRYKLIPQNGDWMPVNFLDGPITKAQLDANPPPFPTHP